MSMKFGRRDLLKAFGFGAAAMTGLESNAAAQENAGDASLTFFGWSDTHVPVNGDEAKFMTAIEAMNTLPGRSYPRGIGGSVDTPAFVFNGGDITDWPTWPAMKTYVDLITNRLRFPSYEILGNHDSADGIEGYPQLVKDWFRQKYGDLSYTFARGGVHFICPFSAYDERLANPAHAISEDALIFIKEHMTRHYSPVTPPPQLAAIPEGAPIVVATHLCYDAITNHDAYVDVMSGGNVVMVLGGHYHKAQVVEFRGKPFVQLPSVNSEFTEVTVFRFAGGRLTAIPFDYVKKEWVEDPGKMLDVAI